MRIFTFYFNRYDNATTSRALAAEGIRHTVLLHNNEQLQRFQEHDTIQDEVIVTGNPTGLAYQRNAALELMKEGEWAWFMSDDYYRVQMLPSEVITDDKKNRVEIDAVTQNYWRFNGSKRKAALVDFIGLDTYLSNKAEQYGAHLVGFANTNNPRKMQRKFSFYGLCDGRCWLVQKTALRFDTNVQSIDDYSWTLQNLVQYGKTLQLNWALPIFQRMTTGGYGKLEERTVMRKRECEYLVNKYYPMCRYANKIGYEKGTHIKIYA